MLKSKTGDDPTSLETRLSRLAVELRSLEAGLRSLPTRLGELEPRLKGIDAGLRRLEAGLKGLASRLGRSGIRPGGLETRLRGLANNLRVWSPGLFGGKGDVMTTSERKPTINRFFQMPWNEIREPGAYVSSDSGRLYRIPDSALKEGHSPLIEVVGPAGEEMVTCVSKNPYTPIEKLRMLTSDANIEPSF